MGAIVTTGGDDTGAGLRRLALLVAYGVVYALLGALSLSTAYLQANAAAVWLPSGFAVGLLLVQGRSALPAVAFGSFLLNSGVNLITPGPFNLAGGLLIAAAIACGNTLEAFIGATIARRFAGGRDFLESPRGLLSLALFVVPVAPLASTAFGVSASWYGGITTPGTVLEVILTWYVANAVGILMFTGPTILLLTGAVRWPPKALWPEAALLILCLVFVSQAISGLYLSDALLDWPKTYMAIPLLLWAAFRFGTQGALFSVVVVVGIAAVGTMRGFQAFPAENPSRSLIYLQLFLGLISLMALLIAATRAQVERLRATLEARVSARTAEIERLLREKDAFTTIVAHDLQSPLYGVRNALRAAIDAIEERRIEKEELAAAMAVMEETCAALAQRVAVLLAPEPMEGKAAPAAKAMRIAAILASIVAAHRLAIDRKGATIAFAGDNKIAISRPEEVEHIMDILIENAIRYSPTGATIDVAAYLYGGQVEIIVSDNGPGISPKEASRLFLPRDGGSRDGDETRNGIGLKLASDLAEKLGGALSYSPVQPNGSRFRLVLPNALARRVARPDADQVPQSDSAASG